MGPAKEIAGRAAALLPWLPMLLPLAILVWTMTVDSLGIIPSPIALVGISSLSRSPFRPLSLLVLAAGLCLLGYFVFIELGMPLTMLGR